MILDDSILNVLENTACKLAAQQNGWIVPHQLLPVLPISLEMVCEALDGLSNEESVRAEERKGVRGYYFSAFEASENAGGLEAVSTCLSCNADVTAGKTWMCPRCEKAFHAALSEAAEKEGWPAQAVYQHEIIYLAAKSGDPLKAEALASRSRYTIRRMRQKLGLLADQGFVVCDNGSYRFPALRYSKQQYVANRAVIERYPASVMEDVEHRMVRIMSALGMVFLLLLALAFWGIPFPLLFIAFLVIGPVMSGLIWRKKEKIVE